MRFHISGSPSFPEPFLFLTECSCVEFIMTTEKLAEDLLTLWRILRGLSHPVRRAEMTPEQYWLLRLLNRAGSLSVGELANELGITTSSATVACKRLEKAGLLT